MPRALREQVLALHDQAWRRSDGAGHDPALRPLSLLLVEGGRVLSALDILSKEIEHAGERYAASGLSTVVTDEALRGRGHGRALVSAAREQIASEWSRPRDLHVQERVVRALQRLAHARRSTR